MIEIDKQDYCPEQTSLNFIYWSNLITNTFDKNLIYFPANSNSIQGNIIHFAGFPNDEKLRKMEQLCDQSQ
jgi:hypothetical protein